MRTYGLSQDYQVATIGEFCYSIPANEHGLLRSRMLVHTPDQNFMLMKRSDWGEMFQRYNGDLGLIGERVCAGESAFLKEPLLPVSQDKLTTYDLNMTVAPYYNNDFVYGVVSNCHNLTNLEYNLAFENPGNFLRRHFSCQDLGLLETYSVLTLLCMAASLKYYLPAFKRSTTDLSCHVYLLVGVLGVLACVAQTLNLLIYSANGLGWRFAVYLGELTELAAKNLSLLAAFSLPPAGAAAGGRASKSWMVGASACAYFTVFFLWTQMTYKNRYVRRLRTGESLAGFGLNIYSSLFGTSFGLLTVCISAILALILALRSRQLTAKSATALYLVMPLLLVSCPLDWPRHRAVWLLTIGLQLPSLGKPQTSTAQEFFIVALHKFLRVEHDSFSVEEKSQILQDYERL